MNPVKCEICRHPHETENHAAIVLANKKARKKRDRARERLRPDFAEKDRLRKRRWYEKISEEQKALRLAKARAAYALKHPSNPDRCRICNKIHVGIEHDVWVLNNRIAARRRFKERLSSDPVRLKKISDRQRKYRESNPEVFKERQRLNWQRMKAKGYTKIKRQNRRALLKAGGRLSKGVVQRLFVLQNGKCPYCKTDLTLVKNHIDHILPLALGGTNTDENVQLLCQPCNQRKHAKHPTEFAKLIGLKCLP